jgi:hypothetical protein
MARPTPAPTTETATFRAVPQSGRRDAATLGVLVAATIGIAVANLSGAERVIPLTAIAAIAIGWARSRREQWSLGQQGISHRRWVVTRTAPAAAMSSVEIVADGAGSADEFVFVAAGVSIPVPLYDVQAQPAFASELRHLLTDVARRDVPGADRALALL